MILKSLFEKRFFDYSLFFFWVLNVETGFGRCVVQGQIGGPGATLALAMDPRIHFGRHFSLAVCYDIFPNVKTRREQSSRAMGLSYAFDTAVDRTQVRTDGESRMESNGERKPNAERGGSLAFCFCTVTSALRFDPGGGGVCIEVLL